MYFFYTKNINSGIYLQKEMADKIYNGKNLEVKYQKRKINNQQP